MQSVQHSNHAIGNLVTLNTNTNEHMFAMLAMGKVSTLLIMIIKGVID
jgi:hypothetical protein